MWIFLTIVVFYITRWIAQQFSHPMVNPLLLSLIIIIPFLLFFNIPYEEYYSDNEFLSYLLQPAVVAMAYPLYEQLPHIQKNWKVILLTCSIGSLLSILSGSCLALWMGVDLQLIASILPKSVTTPIAMTVSEQLGGEAAIAAIFVLLAGLTGALFAYPIYQIIGIKSPLARGLTMGIISHVLGTAQAMEKNPKDAAFSSLALVICGVTTSLIAPSVYSLIVWMHN